MKLLYLFLQNALVFPQRFLFGLYFFHVKLFIRLLPSKNQDALSVLATQNYFCPMSDVSRA